MPEDIKWLIGTAITLLVFFGGMLFTAFNNLSGRLKAQDDKHATITKAGDDVLQDRLNRVRDEYVRRSDLDGHIQRLDNNVKDLREELRETRKETNSRLDVILASLTRDGGNSGR